jgi:large conductance mechanosensitive channel
MGFFQEFREFAMKGNVVDMAVGVIIGGAFGKIVASMVDDVLMPPLGMAIGGVNFKDLAIELKAATESSPAVLLAYGKFLQTVLDFGILALVIFLLVRAMNKLRQEEPAAPAAPPEPSAEERLLAEIRDLLRTRA